ncbi:hypothetical protein AAG906_005317 [Vitis piasezkii]
MQESSPPTSPTPSQMLPPDEPHQLMEKRTVFSTKLTTQTRHKFRDEWYKCMERNRIDIPMFTNLKMYASNNDRDYPFVEVNTLQKDKFGKAASKIVVANHPPLEEVTITTQSMEVIASPFKIINPKDDERRTNFER